MTKQVKVDTGTFGVRRLLLHLPKSDLRLLEYLGLQAKKLYNTGNFVARQLFFKRGRVVSRFDLLYADGVRDSLHFRAMPSTTAQQTLLSVSEAWSSFRELRALWFKEGCPPDRKPRPPSYLERGVFKLAFPNSGGGKPKIVEVAGERMIRFPLGQLNAVWFGIRELLIPAPSDFDLSQVREYTFVPQNGAWYLELSYRKPKPVGVNVDPALTLACDLGTSANLVAAVGTDESNLLIDARQLKAMNQGYNRLVARRKAGKPEGYWDAHLDRLTRKRNDRMRDGINKAARLVLDHCLERGIGTVVVGWNTGIKNRVDLGSRENQKFVQMPLARLKDRIQQLCEEYGLVFFEQEESYTSVSSHLDGDTLPVYGHKPDGWIPSGRRAKRGLYRTAKKEKINADLNGAANILQKWHVTRKPVEGSLQPDRRGRPCLTTAKRVRLWALPGARPASAFR